MEPDLAVLLSTAATTLVALMTTDSWEQAKTGFVRLWRLRNPEQAQAVEADLMAARLAVGAAREAQDLQAEADVAEEWRSRLEQLIADDERLRADLLRLVETFLPMAGGTRQAQGVVMRATAHDSSRIYQAARDQTIAGG